VPGSPPSDVPVRSPADIVAIAEALGIIIKGVEEIVPTKEAEEKREKTSKERDKVSIGRMVLSILQIFFALLMLAAGLISVLREEVSTIIWTAVISLGLLVVVIGLVVAMKREAGGKYSFERKVRNWAWVSVIAGILVVLAAGFWAIRSSAFPPLVAEATFTPTPTILIVTDTPTPTPISTPTATLSPTATATPPTFTVTPTPSPTVTTPAPVTPLPPPPADLESEAISETQVTLSWHSDAQDLTGFVIYRDGEQVAVVDPAKTTYQDSGLQCDTTYNYEVRAVNAAGMSETGAIASVTTSACLPPPPPPPADLKGEAISETQVTLSWYSDAQDLTGFAIYRDGEQVAVVDPSKTTHQDSGLRCDTTYNYEVWAVNAGGMSETGVIASVTTSACLPPPPPTFGGLLAYPVFDVEEQTFDVHIVDVATGAQVRAIEDASQPDVSPDGQEIGYRGWRVNARGLWVELLLGGNRWQASASHEAARPALNNQLVFASNQTADRSWQLYFPGGEDWMGSPIPHGGTAETPAWLPDGRLLFKGCRGTDCGISVANPDGTNATFLTTDTGDRAPAASPDGAQIALMSNRGGSWDLYVMNADGSEPRRLTNDPARDTSPIWSPDGQWIAFVSDREAGKWFIWVIKPDGTDLQRLPKIEEDLGLDGRVRGVPDHECAGWMNEHISWVQP
jgi:chitodextrinase